MKIFLLFALLYTNNLCISPLFGEELDLSQYEKCLYSENGEDGVLAKLFQIIPSLAPFCVEIGAYDGFTNSNTYLLRLQGWKCVLFDRQYESEKFNLHKEFVNAENVNEVLEKYKVPLELDLLAIDVDYNDFYVWRALDPKYRPAVVMIRYNATHLSDQDKVVKYRPFYVGDETDYFGASILALYRLGRAKGYSLIYAEKSGRNLFFLRDDLISAETQFKNRNEVEKIYRPSTYGSAEDFKHRPYLSSEEGL